MFFNERQIWQPGNDINFQQQGFTQSQGSNTEALFDVGLGSQNSHYTLSHRGCGNMLCAVSTLPLCSEDQDEEISTKND